MAVRRGTVYAFTSPSAPSAVGFLVLTNDEWNDANVSDCSGVLVYAGQGAGRIAIPGTPGFAGPLLAVPKAALTSALTQLAATQLQPVIGLLREVLAIDELRGTPARSPAPVPGVITYPRWAQISYAGPPVGDEGETKRQVIVSRDDYNKALQGAVCLRTTTSPKRGGLGFPGLADGTKVVCVLPTFMPNALIRFGPRDGRPVPDQCFRADMIAIAAGLCDSLDL